MDINELLKGIDCACGRHHSCDIEAVYIENGAIEKHLGNLCEGYNNVLLVADENTFSAAGNKTELSLESKNLKKLIFPKKILIPDEKAIERVKAELGDSELIVGIGSGVIQDLCKYVSNECKIPYIIIASAPSMDGYASTGAAMITGGMKVTYPAGLPKAIIADTEILKNAPMDMIKAGFGDIIGKYSALNDWLLSNVISNEYFCQNIYDLTLEQVEKTLRLSGGLLRRDETAVGALMEALVIVGILMSFAGSSRPASGSEHHLSHFFEITGILDKTDYFPHGKDVAYSSVITAGIRENLINMTFPETLERPSDATTEEALDTLYKGIADSCRELQEKVGSYKSDKSPIYKEKEAKIKQILSLCPTAVQHEEILRAVGYSVEEFNKFYGKERIENAVAYAKDLKDRYTVLWLNFDINKGKL